ALGSPNSVQVWPGGSTRTAQLPPSVVFSVTTIAVGPRKFAVTDRAMSNDTRQGPFRFVHAPDQPTNTDSAPGSASSVTTGPRPCEERQGSAAPGARVQ